MAQSDNNIQVNDQFAAIVAQSRGAVLNSATVRGIAAGQIVLVGRGAPATGTEGIGVGCIEHMFYGDGSNDLRHLRVDGKTRSPKNLQDFREALEDAAFHDKCISYCLDVEENRMFMLNIYPRCCCPCTERQ